MATINLSSTHATDGFDMRLRDASSIIGIVTAIPSTAHSPTQVAYHGTVTQLTLNGTFSDFNGHGDPTQGTITSYQVTIFSGATAKTIVVTDLSLSVPDFFAFIAANNTAGLNAFMFGQADTITGSPLKDTIQGHGGDDVIDGADGDDNIFGDVHSAYSPAPPAGNDTLNGGAGNDTLDGGAGDDIMNGGAGADVILSTSGADTIDGGDGFDRLTLDRSSSASPISANLSTLMNTGLFYDGTSVQNVEQITIRTGAAEDTLLVDNGFTGEVYFDGGVGVGDHIIFNASAGIIGLNIADDRITYGAVNILRMSNVGRITATGGSATDSFNGRAGADAFDGGGGNDIINGLGGDDTILGGEGVDTLNGGAGADTIDGGGGNDIIHYNLEGADQIDGGVGTDTIHLNLSGMTTGVTLSMAAFASLSGFALSNGAVLRGIERFGNITFGAGDDTISLVVNNFNGGGATVIGGAGFDRIVGDYSGQSGVITFINFTLNGIVNFSQFEQIQLIGGTGKDTLHGDAGADTLDGGGNADTLVGGAGNDTYVVDNAGDAITELSNGGIDTVQSSITFTLGTQVEKMLLTGSAAINAIGNGLNNTLTGNIGANVLNGAFGADTMIGGFGNDTYFVENAGDLVIELAAQGVDTVSAQISFTLTDNVENLSLTGAADLNGTGNAQSNRIIGNSGANTLLGDAGSDFLFGNAGADVLDGGAAQDQMYGGLGDDTYYISQTNDVAFESAGEGIDIAYSSAANYTISAGIENITLTEAAGAASKAIGNLLANIVTGNSLANILHGKAGADILDGKGGADSMYGGADDDTYYVDNAGDFLFENASEGADTVHTSVSYTLRANFETLILADAGAIDGTGNGGANLIQGNDAANTIKGGGGDDTLIGNGGADTLFGGAGDDDFVFALGAGADVIVDFIAGGAEDSLDFSAYDGSGVTWDITQVGADTLFTFSNGDTLTLLNVDHTQLVAGGAGFYD